MSFQTCKCIIKLPNTFYIGSRILWEVKRVTINYKTVTDRISLLPSENQYLLIIDTNSKVPDSSLTWPRIQIFSCYFYGLSTLGFYFKKKNTLVLAVSQLSAFLVEVHSKSERSVLGLKIGPFRWVKFSPILESNLAPLNQGQYSPIS